jgi:hypothetical protein
LAANKHEQALDHVLLVLLAAIVAMIVDALLLVSMALCIVCKLVKQLSKA